MAYHKFRDEEGNEYGSFETFEQEACPESTDPGPDGYCPDCGARPEDEHRKGGFYWQACFPGCLPDSDPSRPFESEQEAIDDARGS